MLVTNVVDFRAALAEGRREWRGVCIPRAPLAGIDLSGCDLSGAFLRGADLRGARMDGARLVEANLRSVRMAGASLVGTDLRGANLRHAVLAGADLRRADLHLADLRHADVRGARLELAGFSAGCESFEGVALDDDHAIRLFNAILLARFGAPGLVTALEPLRAYVKAALATPGAS